MLSAARNDVLSAIREAIAAIKDRRYAELHTISDHVLHVITVYQDIDAVDLAVAIYALNKILEAERYRTQPKMKMFSKTILQLFNKSESQLVREDYNGFRRTLNEILGSIEAFSKSIRFYIEDILHFAKIKKGTKLYEHGLSLGKAAELAGVTKWELMPAIGETAIHEQIAPLKGASEQKIKFLEKIFNVRRKKK
jgi:hypothetical protein